MESLFFTLPANDEVKEKIIRAIPQSWSYVSGLLQARAGSDSTHEYNQGYLFNDQTPDAPTIYDVMEGYFDPTSILSCDLMPNYYKFIRAGYHMKGKPMCLLNLKRLIGRLIRKDYTGKLDFFRETSYSSLSYHARCSIALGKWEGEYENPNEWDLSELGPQSPRVRIGWSSRQEHDNVEELIQVCRDLRLKEYTSQPATT